MSRRLVLRVAEAALAAVVLVVLPATVSDAGLYLELAGPCLLAAVFFGYLDGRKR